MESDNKSVTMNDASVDSFSEKSFFSVNETTLNQEEDIFRDNPLPLVAQDANVFHHMSINNYQHAIDAEAQGSQGVEGHGQPSALT